MKPAEAKVLEGLRKSTLAYLSEKEYAEVVEAVEKQGILGLTGAASRLVKGAVIKHGSHDQKTHGRKGGGGGGSGGGGDSKQSAYDRKLGEVRDDKRVSAAVADLDKLSKDIDKERAKVKSGPEMVERDDFTRPKAKVLAALDSAQKKIDGDKEKLVAAVKTKSNKEHYQLLQRVGHSPSSVDAVRRGLGEKVADNYMKINDDSLFEYTESLKEAVSSSSGGSRMEG